MYELIRFDLGNFSTLILCHKVLVYKMKESAKSKGKRCAIFTLLLASELVLTIINDPAIVG